MYSVEFTKVYTIKEGRFVSEIYLPLNSSHKRDRDTGSKS